MSETFDPNAWPYPQGGRPQQGSRTAPRDDDYDDLSYEDDFDDYDDDDDLDPEPAARQEPAPKRGNRRNAADDDYDDEYDDDDDYDSYDDDFDNDMSQEGGGRGRKIIGALAAVALLGAFVIGGIVLFGGGNEDPATPPDTAEPSETTTPATPGGATGEPGQAPTDVAETTARALSAWGAFSVTGDFDLVRPYFVSGTNQYAKLQEESEELKADPPGGEPRSYTMTESTATSTTNGDWIIKGVVVVSRTGEQTLRYPWEIRLTRAAADQPWQILTVRQY